MRALRVVIVPYVRPVRAVTHRSERVVPGPTVWSVLRLLCGVSEHSYIYFAELPCN